MRQSSCCMLELRNKLVSLVEVGKEFVFFRRQRSFSRFYLKTYSFVHILKIETCDNANCGIGKRCIMKKGLPKCVCAPNCKATAAANKQQKKNSAKKITVIRMPETRHLKRNEKRLTPSEMQNDEPTLIVANFNRRQGNKKKKNNENEALIYSPLINANLERQVQILQARNTSNATDTVEMKIRSGFFNENTVKVTSFVDGFYIGNLVRFVQDKKSKRNF